MMVKILYVLDVLIILDLSCIKIRFIIIIIIIINNNESAFKKHEQICKNIDFIKTIIPKKEHLLNLEIIKK